MRIEGQPGLLVQRDQRRREVMPSIRFIRQAQDWCRDYLLEAAHKRPAGRVRQGQGAIGRRPRLTLVL
jgi:hypothetical protein